MNRTKQKWKYPVESTQEKVMILGSWKLIKYNEKDLIQGYILHVQIKIKVI